MVSLSLGSSCVFRFGNNETRTRLRQGLILRGDRVSVTCAGPALSPPPTRRSG